MFTTTLLELLFPKEVPQNVTQTKKFNDYIKKLGGYKVEELVKEPSRLAYEKSINLEQTQDLAVSNYKTFIESAECSRKLFLNFNEIESKLEELLADLPQFETKCAQFGEASSGINNLRKLNSLTLTKNAQLLEILELPQLMQSFIDDNLYEQALELAFYVRKIHSKHPEIPIFDSILQDVEKAWVYMLHQLLSNLRKDLSLSKCLQIVGHLRRMDIFTEDELRLKFLQTRNTFLETSLSAIPKNDANFHLNKTIEITRVNLFNIITQYKAIFNDDEHSPLAPLKMGHVNQNMTFFSWISSKVDIFLETLETDLAHCTALESILGQCMYFGLSFSKVGCDFRSQLIPIFTNRIAYNFQNTIAKASLNFTKNLEKFTLINKSHGGVPWKKIDDHLKPPDSLLEFYPLAEFLNNILTAFNELKQCAPLAVIPEVTVALEDSLLIVSKAILMLYAQEHQAFATSSSEAFARMCNAHAHDLIPYLQKCVHVIFPPTAVAERLGVSLQFIQENGILTLKKDFVLEPIQHLLPKNEPIHVEHEVATIETVVQNSDDNNDMPDELNFYEG